MPGTKRENSNAGEVGLVAPAAETPAIFPIVGIGASAGGLSAFEAFFQGMPTDKDPGMAFVLVQHLAPDHKSMLAELIRQYTRLQVCEVEDGTVVKPNCIYILPPNRDMALLKGTLHLLDPVAPRGQRLPIDFFFRSLAQDQQRQAIGIILSGTGSDGTLGVRAIKGMGGLVMAQTPATTEYDGMPRSSIATGLVDFELPPAEMAGHLLAYISRTNHKITKTIGGLPINEKDVKTILILLHAQTGLDFSQYKPSSIHLRIERRLAVHQIESTGDYVKYLQQTPAEVEALYRDMLIGVTTFFRNPEVFHALEARIIPQLFESRHTGDVIRIWCAGCSSGEEAYSLAILLAEYQFANKNSFAVQVFATDIDKRSIARARAGIYPTSISVDISPQRLLQFFKAEPDGQTFRIHKNIRDMVIFSEQDVIKDPPFSKLDMISCRNLLIYMGGELQKKLVPLFHYALKPSGFLLLGTSETIGEFNYLFTTLDGNLKVYQRSEKRQRKSLERVAQLPSPSDSIELADQTASDCTEAKAKLPLRELVEQALLQQIAPAGALVNAKGEILYLNGRTGQYLELPPGETGKLNIVRMARKGLSHDLKLTLSKAAATNEIVRCHGILVKTNGNFTAVNLTIRPVVVDPVGKSIPPLYMVILEDAMPLHQHFANQATVDTLAQPDIPDIEENPHIATLRRELQAKEVYLKMANEQLVTTNQELKCANEEMQSVNEELQSTNEELETSKEELQSLNEELSTTNNELQNRMADLSVANNDMNNLLAGTGIGTIFVDHQLRMLRFTPSASVIINLIPGDVGRPLNHIISNLIGYDSMQADVQRVLDSLIPIEMEVQTKAEKWFTMRIVPYRTMDNTIEGAVITFVEVTESVKTRQALHKANELMRLAVIVRDATDAITMQDLTGRILAWNPGAVRIYGWTEVEALAMNTADRIPKELQQDELDKVKQLSKSEILIPYRTKRIKKNGKVITVSMVSTALVNRRGIVYGIATTERPSQE